MHDHELSEASDPSEARVTRIAAALIAIGLLELAFGLSSRIVRELEVLPPTGITLTAGLILYRRDARRSAPLRALLVACLVLQIVYLAHQWSRVPADFLHALLVTGSWLVWPLGFAVTLAAAALALTVIALLETEGTSAGDWWWGLAAAVALGALLLVVSRLYEPYTPRQRAGVERYALGLARARLGPGEHVVSSRVRTSRFDDRLRHDALVLVRDPNGVSDRRFGWNTHLGWVAGDPWSPGLGGKSSETPYARAVGCALERAAGDGSNANRGHVGDAEARSRFDFTSTEHASEAALEAFVDTYSFDGRARVTPWARTARVADADRMLSRYEIDGAPLSRTNRIDVATAKILTGWELITGQRALPGEVAQVRANLTEALVALDLPMSVHRTAAEQDLLDLLVHRELIDAIDTDPESVLGQPSTIRVGTSMLWAEGVGPPFSELTADGIRTLVSRTKAWSAERPPTGDARGLVSDTVFVSSAALPIDRHYCADGRLLFEHGRRDSPDTLVGHWELLPGSSEERLRVRETGGDMEGIVEYERAPEGEWRLDAGAAGTIELERQAIMSCAPIEAVTADTCEASSNGSTMRSGEDGAL